jgi:hypothetical protein
LPNIARLHQAPLASRLAGFFVVSRTHDVRTVRFSAAGDRPGSGEKPNAIRNAHVETGRSRAELRGVRLTAASRH